MQAEGERGMFAFLGGRRASKRRVEEKRKAFRETFLKGVENTRSSLEAQRAILYCESVIGDYEQLYDWNEARWLGWQRVAIVAGVVATLAGVITLPASWLTWIPEPGSLSWLRGVPAAIATIATSYLSSFTYREDAVRDEVTSAALWSELTKYLVKAEPYNKNEADDTSTFINVTCRIVEAELHSWRTLVVGDQTEARAKKVGQEVLEAK